MEPRIDGVRTAPNGVVYETTRVPVGGRMVIGDMPDPAQFAEKTALAITSGVQLDDATCADCGAPCLGKYCGNGECIASHVDRPLRPTTDAERLRFELAFFGSRDEKLAKGVSLAKIREWFRGECPGCRRRPSGIARGGITCGAPACHQAFTRAIAMASYFVDIGYAIRGFVWRANEEQARVDARILMMGVVGPTVYERIQLAVETCSRRVDQADDVRTASRWFWCMNALAVAAYLIGWGETLRDVTIGAKFGGRAMTLCEARDLVDDYADRIRPDSVLAHAIRVIRGHHGREW